MSGRRLRLSPSASLTTTSLGVILRSDLGSFQLQGRDLPAFLTELVPLLDGSRDEESVVQALPTYSRRSVLQLIQSLEHHGLVEAGPERETNAKDRRWYLQELFFKKWIEGPKEAIRRLHQGRVLVAGLEPWGVTAANDLAHAGLGRLHLLDGASGAEALTDEIARSCPWCEVSADTLEGFEQQFSRSGDSWDLIVVTLPADELLVARQLALAAHRQRVPSLWARLEGLEAVLGPLVIPGKTACWNCCRVRMLGNATEMEVEHALHKALLEARPQRREHILLEPMGPVLGHLIGLEAVKLLTRYTESGLVGRFMVQNLVTLENTFHTVVRLPWCEVCGGADDGRARAGGGAWGGGDVSAGDDAGAGGLEGIDDPAKLRAALAGWVDPRVGIIRYLGINEQMAGEPELPITGTAVLSAGRAGTGPGPEIGSGKGLTAVDAMLGAVGEAIERYSASLHGTEQLRRAPLTALDGDVLDPRRLSLYLPWQYELPEFPFARFDPEQPIDWTSGRWVDNDEPVWVPALPVYFNYACGAPAIENFCQVTSNGLATGTSLADAALRALFELVERDAFMLTWLSRLPARRVTLNGSLDAGSGEVVRQLGQAGCEVRAYLLEVGTGIPAIACIGLGNGKEWPGATASLAAHLSPRQALRKAILEQGHVGPYVRRLMLSAEHPIPAARETVRTLTEHALYYVPPERCSSFEFLFNERLPPVQLRDLPEPPEVSMRECARRLEAAEVRVAIVDVTSPDVASGPFRVARALGTDMQPIHFGHDLARLANPRLQARLSGPVNPDPHPVA